LFALASINVSVLRTTWIMIDSIGSARLTGCFMIVQEDLTKIIKLASSPLPNRPDGTVVCVMYSSVDDLGCTTYDGEFDRCCSPVYSQSDLHLRRFPFFIHRPPSCSLQVVNEARGLHIFALLQRIQRCRFPHRRSSGAASQTVACIAA
jgi:hypothetical protein